MNTKSTAFIAMALIAAAGTPALAQWSDDSTIHQVVADGSGEQVQPKMVPTLDGGCYISWYSSEVGYDVRLQRLDASGNEMWAHNGILIADRGFSSTEDYGLDVDSNGNAVLAFRDDRFGGVVVTAQSIAPDGTALWGANGVQLGNSADSIHSPDIASTSDGKAVVGWINNLDTNLAQIDEMGSTVWTTALSDPGGQSINVASMHRSDNGAVIVSWVQYGFFLGPKHLHAQKIASDGTEAWASPAAVFDGGSLQFGNYPEFVADGSGGAVFSWYDTANGLNVYAQHILSDGSEAFPHDGAVASTVLRERVSPAATYDPATDSVYVSWIELDNNQGNHGVYAQRIDASGARLWTDGGKVISAIDTLESGTINTNVLDGNLVVSWIENAGGFGLEQVLAHAVKPDGTDAWAGGTVAVASDSAERARLTTTVSSDGFLIAGWQVGDFGVADLETHNINADGSLGVSSCAADLTGDGSLNFLDVSAFLTAFGNMDPSADFEADGSFNFLDVSAFLSAFGAGCP